jgi:hypothetical protein
MRLEIELDYAHQKSEGAYGMDWQAQQDSKENIGRERLVTQRLVELVNHLAQIVAEDERLVLTSAKIASAPSWSEEPRPAFFPRPR